MLGILFFLSGLLENASFSYLISGGIVLASSLVCPIV